MKRPIVSIHNSETNEIIEREMEDSEFAVYESDIAESKQFQIDKAKAEADKASAKASAQAKLAALGLTKEEVASILG